MKPTPLPRDFRPRRRAFHRMLLRLGLASLGGPALAASPRTEARPALHFPRDFGSHPEQGIEWWYITGWARSGDRLFGYQITFFRSRLRGVEPAASAFNPEHLLFAHAALSDVQGGRLWHAQRSARAGMGLASADTRDTAVYLHPWRLERHEGPGPTAHYLAELESDDFALRLRFEPSQPRLLQGQAGYSQKGPGLSQFSRYYSEPQLGVRGSIRLQGQDFRLDDAATPAARAWLDHEWSDELLSPEAAGWDWMGLNLFDGTALMAFRMRGHDGQAIWDASTLRRPGGPTETQAPGQTRLRPGTRWRSPRSQAEYPIEWTLELPGLQLRVKAVLADQELDSRLSTGAIYWEGLSEVFDLGGRLIGRGYVELTGYAKALRL